MTFSAKGIRILFVSTLTLGSFLFGACSDKDIGTPTDDSAPADDACITSEDCPVSFICEDGACVPPNTDTATNSEPSSSCIDGETQSCGTDVGPCQSGTQTCTNEVWGDCIGSIAPVEEECNGIDDDCDGEIPDRELDGDGDGFTECDGDCNNSNPNVNPLASEACNGKDDNCNEEIDEDTEAACDDGLFCNGVEVCEAAQCRSGNVPSCSGLNTQCTEGLCDESLDTCVERPLQNETPCDDGIACTQSDQCNSGICDGFPLDCSQLNGSCALGICDELAGGCVPSPFTDGTSCADGLFCNGAETCQSGACTPGALPLCDSLNEECVTGRCDEPSNSCVTVNLNNGTDCNDNLFCTQSDQCTNGVCSGSAINCSHLNDDCNRGTCSESYGGCYADDVPNGMACEDGDFCTSNDNCVNGTCVPGNGTDCGAVTGGDPCYDGVCDEGMNQCIAVDNNSCNVCDTGSPIANAGPDQEVIPQDTVSLNGASSTDPDNQSLNYTWTLSERPPGSSSALTSANSVSPTILVDIAGNYKVCLTVNDSDGCTSEEDCMMIIVKPQVDFHVELVWDIDSSDLDLHYRAPGGTFFDSCSSTSTDCYYCSTNPDWGLNGQGVADGNSSNDPSLDVDNVSGYGPENINLGTLFDHSSAATVGVHYYCNHGGGTATARIRIYVGGELEYEVSKVLNQTEFWEVADISVSGSGTAVGLTPLNTALYTSTTQSCH